MAGRLIVAIIGLASVALLTRHLGPDGFGLYRTILTVTGVGAIAADLGMDMVVLRTLSRGDISRGFLASALILRLTATGCIMLLVAAAAQLLPYGDVVTTGVWIAAPFYICFQAALMLQGVFQKHLRQDLQMAAETAGNLVMLGIIYLGILTGQGVLFMIAAMVAGGFVQLTILVIAAGRFEPLFEQVDPRQWWPLLREGLPIAGSQAALMMILRGDILLLSLLASATAVGLYGVPSKMFEVLGAIGAIYSGIMMPRFIEAMRGGHLNSVAVGAFDGALIAAGSIILSLGLFAEPVLVLVAGSEFAPAAAALVLVSVGIGANIISRLLRNLLLAQEHQHLLLRTDLAVLVFAIALYVSLIPKLSYIGAALATAATESILALTLSAIAYRKTGLHYPTNRLIRIGLAIAIAAIGALMMEAMPWLLNLILTNVVFLIALFVLKIISREYIFSLLNR